MARRPCRKYLKSVELTRKPEEDMTTVQKQKIARRKLSLLQLAQELGNVSKACRLMGYSRQQFYEIRRNYQTYGADGLIDQLPGARGPHPNRVGKEIEEAILAHALQHPTHGAQRVSDELRLRGIDVSAGGVRGVWSRHELQTKHERLLRLEETVRKRKLELSDEQIRLLERYSPEFRERHIKTRYTGDLVAVDTFYAGHLKGVGSDLRPVRPGLPQPVRLGPLLHLEAPGDGRAGPEQRRLALLRGARGSDHHDPLGQRAGVLRPGRPAPLRALPTAGGDRAPEDEGPAPAVQRLHRALPPHAAGRAPAGEGAYEVVRVGRGDARRIWKRTWSTTTASARTRAAT